MSWLCPCWSEQPRRIDSMSKVLIIDDDSTAREVLGARLESLGHAVFLEADGTAGLQACRLRRPDVVLLDLRLPDCDGLEILAQLKEECPETEVIILTAYEIGRASCRERV